MGKNKFKNYDQGDFYSAYLYSYMPKNKFLDNVDKLSCVKGTGLPSLNNSVPDISPRLEIVVNNPVPLSFPVNDGLSILFKESNYV